MDGATFSTTDEEAAIKARESAARLANPGWEIWPVYTYALGWQWQAVPTTAPADAYRELAGEKNSEHWPIWGEIPPGGYLLGFGSISGLQAAIDEVTAPSLRLSVVLSHHHATGEDSQCGQAPAVTGQNPGTKACPRCSSDKAGRFVDGVWGGCQRERR